MLTPDIPGIVIVDELGRGGFSVVYRAEQTGFGRTVAAKVLALDPDDAEVVQAFMAEARNIGELASRRDVVTVYETGLASDGRPYLLLQYLPGGSLADRVDAEGPLPVEEVLAVGLTVANVLVAAHDLGILHCDLKPANVLFDADGQPVLADFGIARATAAVDSSRSMAFLTPDHAAPELWEGRPPSVATDLYALGSMLHQLLVGRPPFQDPTGIRLPPLQVMRRVLAEPAPPIVRPDVPAPLANLVAQLLSKDASDRPSSAEDVVAALAAVGAPAGTDDSGRVDGGAPADPSLEPPPPVAQPLAAHDGGDDRTRRRVGPAEPLELVDPLVPPSVGGVATAPPTAGPDAAAEPTPPPGFGDGDLLPASRSHVHPVAVVTAGGLVVLIAIAVAFLLLRDDGGTAAPTSSSSTTSSSIVEAPAAALTLSGEAVPDGNVRVLAGTMTGEKPWIASIEVLEGSGGPVSTDAPIGVILAGDDRNPIKTGGGGPAEVRVFVSEMRSVDGGTDSVPLPSDRSLCFRTVPDDPAAATTVCDRPG